MLDQPDTGPKTFTASDQGDQNRPPIPIRLEGVYAAGTQQPGQPEAWALDLKAMGMPPLAVMDSMRDAIIMDEGSGQQAYNPAAVIGFIRGALEPNDAQQFMALVHDKSRLVRLEVLGSVMLYLSERYTGRPIGAPSSSGSGGAQTAPGAQGA